MKLFGKHLPEVFRASTRWTWNSSGRSGPVLEPD